MTIYHPLGDVPVEAFQWLGQPMHNAGIPIWAHGAANVQAPTAGVLEITTRSGRTNARLSEWVVRYVDGSVDVFPDSLFRICYNVKAVETAAAHARTEAEAARAHTKAAAEAKTAADAKAAHDKAAAEASAKLHG